MVRSINSVVILVGSPHVSLPGKEVPNAAMAYALRAGTQAFFSMKSIRLHQKRINSDESIKGKPAKNPSYAGSLSIIMLGKMHARKLWAVLFSSAKNYYPLTVAAHVPTRLGALQ